MKIRKKLNAFTLLEMIIVMIIIGVVLIITLPNIQQKREVINNKGCEALVEVVNSQILLYELDHDTTDVTIDDLIAEGYLKESQSVCPGGAALSIENGQAVSH